ncbi:E3 ubiquitin-protein ligase MPSR1-like [Dioscorea cayenensis subsp. rotundata]|uniref:RING-type E3 ubiquitin transferase n=1 Tax=Dioscorea cayennensis subsp. rotundata TaxID=55577 RepID=A0AB40AG71_DIOCR|nr:E3 ubiquitin-protein ligase MPSR1-like [Dioscorea cayenensis subsp. rotundata]
MASEPEIGAEDGGRTRARFFPIIIGVVGPPPSDRVVLVNPLTQGMVILQGGMELVSEILSSGGVPPASKASIEAMRRVEGGEEVEEECSVCLDAMMVAVEAVKEMPCGHRYHERCIERWLRIHGSCPICRYRMPVEERRGSDKSWERELWFLGFGSRGRSHSDEGDGDPE